jgi:hypothetical protein
MFARFKANPRLLFGSACAGEMEKIIAKLKAGSGPMSFDAMLAEIRGAMSLFSEERAQSYFDYWNAFMTRRQAVPGGAEVLTMRAAS